MICQSQEAEILEVDDEEDEDPVTLSQSVDRAGPTSDQTAGLRRRPFLIFNKIKQRGYKKLTPKPTPKTTLLTSKGQPGDGFSGREVRPNGLNLLTRAGKQFATSPHIGILDLTQSESPTTKPKRSRRKANLDDNSFVSAPKKRARIAEKSSLVPKAPIETETTEPVTYEKEAQHSQKNHAQDDAPEKDGPGKTSQQANAPTTAPQAILDTVTIERSDDVHDDPDRISRRTFVVEEGRDSCETHISETPPRQPRARSASPAAFPQQDPGAASGRPSPRVFRRFNTQ